MLITMGQREDGPVALKAETFQRHLACLGSSGSGKTVACKVICEEFIRQGVPVIAIDPQGDIACMGERAELHAVTEKGVPAEILEQYDQRADVVVWTPASSKGIPLCVNPLNFDFESDEAEVVVHSLSTMATSICSLIGYDLEKDDGDSAQSFLYMVFEHIYRTGRAVDTFTALVDQINDLPEEIARRAASIISEREIRTLTRRLLNLTIGAKGLMFERGVPLDIDTLLGLDQPSDKTRLSVIYLNTLASQEEKDFFLSQIAERLYHWMLKHPPGRNVKSGVQAIFYIDEIAKFIPPVRKPASKDALMMLFRQARKYGVGCVVATQSPGDIDYTALDQFATWNLGQLKSKQIKAKIINFLQALAPENAEEVVDRLPGLHKGNFIMLSADEFDEPVEYQVRWLVTRHGSPLSDDDVAKRTTDEMRKRFNVDTAAAKIPRGVDTAAPPMSPEELDQHAAAVEKLLEDEGRAMTLDALVDKLDMDADNVQCVLDALAKNDRVAVFYALPGQDFAAPPAPEALPSADSDQPAESAQPTETEADRALDVLRKAKRAMTTSELCEALGATTSNVLRLMNELVDQGVAAKDKSGASNIYWDAELGLRPEIGLTEPLTVAQLKVPESRARTLAEDDLGGLFAKSERITDTEFEHVLLWQVDVSVEREHGLIFKSKEQQTGTLYLLATDGRICSFEPGEGFAFSEVIDDDPLRIKDLDDVCTFAEQMPDDAAIDKVKLRAILRAEEVKKLVERKYIAKAERVRLALLPCWRFQIESTDGSKRRELVLDAVAGKPLKV